ncbi:MAG: hypothetical protein U0Q11_21530 [Vicinamibacterales bacterium]
MADSDRSRRATTRLHNPHVLVALLFLALTVVLTYPLSVHPWSTTFPGSSDRNLYAWTLAWDAHALLHRPLAIFDANIFHPYARTLAYSENLIGAAMLVAPVQWVVQDPFLSFNLAALASVPLCAFGAYLLACRLGLDTSSAWICGLVFGFAPPRFLRIDQLHLTSVQWIPFCLAYAHSYVRTRRAFDLRVALAFLSLQLLTSGHGAVFLLAALAGLVVYLLATGERVQFVSTLRDAGLVSAIVLLPAALVFVPYRLVQLEVGLRRDLNDWTGSWASFLASPTHLDAFLLNHLGTFGAWITTDAQAYLFPGLLPVLLAGAAFFVGRQHTSRARTPGTLLGALATALELTAFMALAAGIYIAMSGANRLVLGGLTITVRQVWRVWALAALLAGVRMTLHSRVPFSIRTRVVNLTRARLRLHDDMRVFYLLIVIACLLLAVGPPLGPWRYIYWIPGLSFIRVPSRFMILGTLGVAVLCAYGFARLTRATSKTAQRMATVATTVALVVEFAVVPFEVVASPREIPMADRWLATQPTPFVVAELPPMDPTIPMLHSTVHWQKTVHGYSGWNPDISQQIAAALPSIPDPASLNLLSRIGVTYLVVHTSMYDAAEWRALEPKLAASERLEMRYADAEGRVYELKR